MLDVLRVLIDSRRLIPVLLAHSFAARELNFAVVAGHLQVAGALVRTFKSHRTFPVAGSEFAFAREFLIVQARSGFEIHAQAWDFDLPLDGVVFPSATTGELDLG